jgi:lipopolysaccharide transport system permease protein
MSVIDTVETKTPPRVRPSPPTVVTPPLAAAHDHDSDSSFDLIIEPKRGWIGVDWREMYRFRELLAFLVWRDMKVRYKQTVLGVAWAVLLPAFSAVILTLIMSRVAGLTTEGVPHLLYYYCGLWPWVFFANATTQAGQSLVNQSHLLTKIYLPRLFFPTATVAGNMIDFFISAGVLAVLMAWYRVLPGVGILMLPVLIVLTLMVALGLSYIFAALTLAYRDFRYAVPVLVQSLMYVSNVIVAPTHLPEWANRVISINPMAGLVENYHAAVLGTPWNWTALAISSVVSVFLFVLGLYYFRKTERRFADIV